MNPEEKQRGQLPGQVYVLMAALLWSTGGVLIKFVPWNGIVVNGIRSMIAFLFFAVLRRSVRIRINRTVVLSAVTLTVTTTTFVLANKLTTAANAIVLQYTAPIYVLIISCIQRRKRPQRRQLMVIVTAFAGVVLFFMEQLETGHMLGNILAVISGVAYAGVIVVNSQPEGDSDESFMLSFALSAALSLPFIALNPPRLTAVNVPAVIVMGIFQVALPYHVFAIGAKRSDPVDASLLSMVEAVANPIWVFLVFGEKPSALALLGAALILASIAAHTLLQARETRGHDRTQAHRQA